MRTFAAVFCVLVLFVTACGSDSEPTVRFDGQECDYSGPRNFDVGLVSFTFVNDYKLEATAAVFRLEKPATWNDFLTYAQANPASDPPDYVNLFGLKDADAGTDDSFTVDLSQPGTWGVTCLTTSEDTDRIFPAAPLEVEAAS